MNCENIILCSVIVIVILFLIMRNCKNSELFNQVPQGSSINSRTSLGCCKWATDEQWDIPGDVEVLSTGSGTIERIPVDPDVASGDSESTNLRTYGPGCVCGNVGFKSLIESHANN